LKGFNTKGTLDITTGKYTLDAKTPAGDVTKLKQETKADTYDFTYDTEVLPGRDMTISGDAISFVIDKNTYSIKTDDFISLIDAKYKTMQPGANYIFNIKVNKTAVQVEAYIADWTTVDVSDTPSNGTKVDFAVSATNMNKDFDMYVSSAARATDASSTITSFGNTPISKYVYNNNKYSLATGYSTIYWPDNSTYYHFRGLVPAGTTVYTDGTNGDYVNLTTAINSTYTDVLLGAPYTSTTTMSKALGPTSNAVQLDFRHKMAIVQFVVKTTSDASAVTLSPVPTIELKCKDTGKLRLGDGSIDVSGGTITSYTPTTGTYDSGTNTVSGYQIGVVPQSTAGLSLKVTTADKNVYPISDLSKLKSGSTAITAWEPGKIYVYTLTLQKSGLTLSVTLADWTTVNGDNETVVIK
jgi:hypothetical protein